MGHFVRHGLNGIEGSFSNYMTALQLPSLKGVHVVVFGDLMLDRYWRGEARRISPEAPVPIVEVQAVEDRPGGAGNIALNLVSLGARCTLLGCVGRDAEGRSLRQVLEAAGVRCDLVEVDDWATVVKVRIISQQQLLRSDFESPTPAAAAEALAAKLPRHLADATALVIGDYDKGAVTHPAGLIETAKAAGTLVVVDPKFKPFSAYAGADLLKPNKAEFTAAAGDCADVNALGAAAQSFCESLHIGAVVVTAGADGMTVVVADQIRHLPAHPIEVFDVTGAGDTAAAALAVAASLGWPVLDCARLANLAASLVVAKSGTAAVTGPELSYAAAKEADDGAALTEDQLLLLVAGARQSGRRIVFTNGCFDILHAGHVAYLEQARRLGDHLIVAVNDDASVARLKGSPRPVNALARRMRVLAGMKAVDWVVSFADDTPKRLLELVRPDVLAKGGDYRREEVVGTDIVTAYGGAVEVLGLVEDCSTTAILQRPEQGGEALGLH